MLQHRQCRSKSAAIGHDHDRHPGKRACGSGVAVQLRKLFCRFIEKSFEAVLFPEFSGAGIRRIDRELGRHQHGIDARFRDLRRHLLSLAHVVREIGAVPVEKDDDHAGLFDVETFRNMKEDAAVLECVGVAREGFFGSGNLAVNGNGAVSKLISVVWASRTDETRGAAAESVSAARSAPRVWREEGFRSAQSPAQ